MEGGVIREGKWGSWSARNEAGRTRLWGLYSQKQGKGDLRVLKKERLGKNQNIMYGKCPYREGKRMHMVSRVKQIETKSLGVNTREKSAVKKRGKMPVTDCGATGVSAQVSTLSDVKPLDLEGSESTRTKRWGGKRKIAFEGRTTPTAKKGVEGGKMEEKL